MEKSTIEKEIYENKYIDSGEENSVLVAPQTPGSKILKVFDFEKDGEIYPDFKDKYVTDIWWWLSSLAFELAPSVEKITVVDPIHKYDIQSHIQEELKRAKNRIIATEKIQEEWKRDLVNILGLEKEVIEGIEKREKYTNISDNKITINNSFAQNIEWIPSDSQDIVFLNFVLDKLYKNDSSIPNTDTNLEKEIIKALKNAYKITKPWGKIYGIHNSMHEDPIMNALNRVPYEQDAQYKDNKRYVTFIIDKK